MVSNQRYKNHRIFELLVSLNVIQTADDLAQLRTFVETAQKTSVSEARTI